MNPEISQKIEALVLESMADQLVPGLALAVVEADQITHLKGYGFADLERRTPFTERTSYQIGSTSKNITGFAIAQLLERGLIDLDARVKTYLPFFEVNHPQSDSITLRHLLGQTSGLGATAWVYERTAQEFDDASLERQIRDLRHLKLERNPGEAYEYSNYHYTILGHIIERVTDMAYEDYVLQHVFKPLGMTRTLAPKEPTIPRDLEAGRGYVPGTHAPNVERGVALARAWNASGLIVSNAADIARYLVAQLNGSVALNSAALERTHAGLNLAESTLGGDCQYGFGWETAHREGLRVVEHGGDARTSGSYFLLLPDQKIAVGILMNLVDHGKIQLVYNIAITLLGLETDAYQPLPKPEPLPSNHFQPNPSLWAKFVGEYHTLRGRLEVFTTDSELWLILAKGNPVQETVVLEARTDTEFIARSKVLAFEGTPFSFEVTSSGTFLHCEGGAFPKLEVRT